MGDFIKLYPEQAQDGMIFSRRRVIWFSGDTLCYELGGGKVCQFELTPEDVERVEEWLLGEEEWV